MKNLFHHRGTETQRGAKQFLLSLCLCASVVNGFAVAADVAPELYRKHCAECHGADRFGLMGPALLPENLSRLRKDRTPPR
jgi:mono/diheme cytochrome c family protein